MKVLRTPSDQTKVRIPSFADPFPGGFLRASVSILLLALCSSEERQRTKSQVRHSSFPHYPVTSVPIFSPFTTRLRLWALKKSNTMIGIRLSMHIENAVESITFSRFTSASV